MLEQQTIICRSPSYEVCASVYREGHDKVQDAERQQEQEPSLARSNSMPRAEIRVGMRPVLAIATPNIETANRPRRSVRVTWPRGRPDLACEVPGGSPGPASLDQALRFLLRNCTRTNFPLPSRLTAESSDSPLSTAHPSENSPRRTSIQSPECSPAPDSSRGSR
jgi:hypothetical protein